MISGAICFFSFLVLRQLVSGKDGVAKRICGDCAVFDLFCLTSGLSRSVVKPTKERYSMNCPIVFDRTTTHIVEDD